MSRTRQLSLVLGHALLVGFLAGLLLGQWNGARTGTAFGPGSWLLLVVALLFGAAGLMLAKILRDDLSATDAPENEESAP